MKKIWLKKAVSLALVAGMTLSLAACGGKDSSDKNGDSGKNDGGTSTTDSAAHYFRADYVSNLPDAFKNSSGGNVMFCGDRIFYSGYNEDYTEQTVYALDVLTGDNVEYFSLNLGDTSGDIYAETASFNQFCADAEGNLYVMLSTRQLDESTIDKSKYENTTKED